MDEQTPQSNFSHVIKGQSHDHFRTFTYLIIALAACYIAYLYVNKPLPPTQDKVTITKDSSSIVINNWQPKTATPPATIYVPQTPDSLLRAFIAAVNALQTVREYDSVLTVRNSGGDTTGIARIGLTITGNELKQMRVNLQTFNKTVEHYKALQYAVYGGALFNVNDSLKAYVNLAYQGKKRFIWEVGKEIGGKGFYVSGKVPMFTKVR